VRKCLRARWTVATLALTFLLSDVGAPSALSQQAPAPPAAGELTAAQKYKNIQVLKDLPASQLHDAMTFMAASMGGNCLTCHVRVDGEFAYEKDDNDHKVTARTMLQMVRAINDQHFKGEERITCSTCHQARREPSALPPLAQPLTPDQIAALAQRGAARPAGGAPGQPGPPGQAGGAPPPGAPGPGGRNPRPTETVDQVLDRYVQALGGRDALLKLTSRVRRGTVTNRAGQSSPITLEETSAGLFRATIASTPATSRASDGTSGWVETAGRIRDLDGVESANAGLPADLALGLRIKDGYSAVAVRAYDRVNGHDVIAVEGRRSPAVTETLYFDRTSGLLVRRMASLRTPLGHLPAQIDYDDYRPVDGIQTPFDVRITDWESVLVEKFAEVTFNQAIDATRFAKPAPKPGL
jgi:ferredoxin